MRNGLEGVLKHIGTLETKKTMRVLNTNHKQQTIKPGKYDFGFEYQPAQKMGTFQMSIPGGGAAANVPLFMKEGAPAAELKGYETVVVRDLRIVECDYAGELNVARTLSGGTRRLGNPENQP